MKNSAMERSDYGAKRLRVSRLDTSEASRAKRVEGIKTKKMFANNIY